MRISIDMPGLKELDDELAKLGHEIATEFVTVGIKASADLLAEGWRLGAPFDPNSRQKSWTTASGEVRRANYGHLNQNIRVRSVVPQNQHAVVFKVTTGDAFWGYFREFGTVKQPARPWARPIIESLKDKCVQVQIATIRAKIEARAAKFASRKFAPSHSFGRNG